MKRNLLVIVIVAVIIMSLSGCGSKTSEVNPIEAFVDRVQTISAANSELTDYSMGTLVDQGSGLYGASAIVDGETIGAISVNVEGEEIAEIVISFSANGPAEKEFRQPVIASAMAMDSNLDYSTAKDIVSELTNALIFGESPVKTINEYTYSAEWREDDNIFIAISR